MKTEKIVKKQTTITFLFILSLLVIFSLEGFLVYQFWLSIQSEKGKPDKKVEELSSSLIQSAIKKLEKIESYKANLPDAESFVIVKEEPIP